MTTFNIGDKVSFKNKYKEIITGKVEKHEYVTGYDEKMFLVRCKPTLTAFSEFLVPVSKNGLTLIK